MPYQMMNEAGDWQDAFDAIVGAFGLDMSDSTPAKWWCSHEEDWMALSVMP